MTGIARPTVILCALCFSTPLLAQQDSEQATTPRELPPEVIQESKEIIGDTVQPLSPDEIEFVRQKLDETQRATRDRYSAAKTVVTTQAISNKPGSDIPTLYAGVGFNTNIIFNDAAGNPWPVLKDSVGSQEAFTVNKIADHILQIQVNSGNSFSNLSVLLEGMKSLLVINIKPPQEQIDVSKTYVVEGQLSPAGNEAMQQRTANTQSPSLPINKELNKFLDGVIPEDANPIPIQSGPNVDVWAYKEQVIVKTQMRLMVPSTDSEPLHGSNGWRVYAISRPNSTMSFIDDGKPVIVSVAESAIAHIKEKG